MCCLALWLWTGTAILGATEPAYEHETPQPAKSHVQLSVPEKKWLGEELYTTGTGHYEVLIWGHAETPGDAGEIRRGGGSS